MALATSAVSDAFDVHALHPGHNNPVVSTLHNCVGGKHANPQRQFQANVYVGNRGNKWVR